MLEERKQRNVTVRCVSEACDLRAMQMERFREACVHAGIDVDIDAHTDVHTHVI